MDSVDFLGFIVDRHGRDISPTKAVLKIPSPKDLGEVIIEMINHYGQFLPNLSDKCGVFHRLMKKESPWQWTEECQDKFFEVQSDLATATSLVHFDR